MKRVAIILLAALVILPAGVFGEEDVSPEPRLRTIEEIEAAEEEDDRVYEEKTLSVYTGAETLSVTVQSCPEMAKEVLAMVNEERAKAGVPALKADDKLLGDALQRAAEITVSWGHTRPDGSKCTSLSKRFSGETLARGQTTGEWAMEEWMESKAHKKIILKESYKRIAVACVKRDDTFYWVQLFGY